MKLLTSNTHSIIEENYKEKLEYFAQWIADNDYDVVTVQESNQTHNGEEAELTAEYIPSNENIVIKKDNHLLNTIKFLNNKGKKYYWVWTPVKIGYDIYDEGIGIISKEKPKEIKEFYLTESKSYKNWKVRKALGIKIEIDGKDRWFYTVHTGWWDDSEECFENQLARLNKELRFVKEDIYLMGDFNNPAEIRDEGYDALLKSGWNDTYTAAEKRDEGITVSGLIDGWKEHKELNSMRIDFIFKNNKNLVMESKVVFNGKNGKVVSDHFAVEITE